MGGSLIQLLVALVPCWKQLIFSLSLETLNLEQIRRVHLPDSYSFVILFSIHRLTILFPVPSN